ncbi:Stress response protein SCP2 [Streptomyces aidingensis]|uniref:Stress response protein SCP2 n=1 Tax=Streptomyces aidingensis TaxID=910347 RepID=A0A1I1L8I1_9ACTN|nr:Stress response protein SCP2 [Streptomyces aidingensis]
MLALGTPVLRAEAHWPARGGGAAQARPRLSVLLLGPAGRVRGPEDFVAGPRTQHPSGQVRRLPPPAGGPPLDAVQLALAGLAPDVQRLVLAVDAGGALLASAGPLRLLLRDAAGGEVGELPLAVVSPRDTALVCGEVSRGGAGWMFRATRRGFPGGAAELAAAFGAVPGGGTPPGGAPARGGHPPPAPRDTTPVPQPDPAFTLPPQGPQFRPGHAGP